METIEAAAQKIQRAVESLGFLTVRESSMKSSQVTLVCRMSDGATRMVEGVVFHLLKNEDGWQSHLCRRYFYRDGSLKAGWNFAFRSDDMPRAAERIVRVLTLYKEQYLVPQGTFKDPGPLGSAVVPYADGTAKVVRMDGRDRNIPDETGRGAKGIG
jgi:hypothetical protein